MNDVEIIPYAPTLIESMRSLGYSFETAIADLIDNSISALAKRIDIIMIPSNNPKLIIMDNGCGMTRDKLEQAMRYGCINPLNNREETDLGRFGLGLKSASFSQCKKMIVVSKREGSVSAFSWDLDYIIEKNNWICLEYDEENIKLLPKIELLDQVDTGTYILLEKFDRIDIATKDIQQTMVDKLSIAKEHISLVFHRFIDDGISIYINNDKIEAKDPFLLNHNATQPLREQKIFINEKEITVKPYILPHFSALNETDIKKIGGKEELKNSQGFYIYRNKRLIIWGTWFRLTRIEELFKQARIKVDIPNSLDYMWEIDIKKSSAKLPDLIKKQLYSCIEESTIRSQSIHEYRGTNRNKNYEIQSIWNRIDTRDDIEYKINRDIPQIKCLMQLLDKSEQKIVEDVLKTLEHFFPTRTMYIDIAKDKLKNIEDDNDKELYDNLRSTLQSYEEKGQDVRIVFEAFMKTEEYANNSIIRDRIEKEFFER